MSRSRSRITGKTRKTKTPATRSKTSSKVLALDIAGRATGWALGQDHTLLDYGKYVSNLRRGRAQRLSDFGQWLSALLKKERPDIVLIEKPYLGRNSNVLVNLSKYIAIAEVSIYDSLSIDVEEEWFLDPRSVKKGLKLKKPKSKQSAKAKHEENKVLMVKRINELYGLKLVYDANSKTKSDDDCADAIALLHFWWLLQDGGES